jgi:integrase
MATKLSDFKKATYKAGGKIIEVPNLYQSITSDKKQGHKYLARFNYEGKIKTKILGYSKKNGNIILSVKEASKLLDKYKADIEEGFTPPKTIKLDNLFDLYFDTLTATKWCKIKKGIYARYIQKPLGKKSIDSIKQMHIKRIIADMDKQGLSPRTQKSVLEVLKPMFNFATTNKIIKDNPSNGITVKIPNQKKIVTGATALFKKVYAGITAYYHDNPYYKALFLFGFTGRRKSEILNLKWENIDLINNYYWIEDTKNNDKQKYELPNYIIEPLSQIKDDRKGLVFKSLVTGKQIQNIDRQMRQLKKFIGVDNLSLHYMRNILVSALAEQQIEAVTLSGILGHKDINTINKYLSTNHYKSSQIGLNKVDDILDVEVL